jgi:hypothetical protein
MDETLVHEATAHDANNNCTDAQQRVLLCLLLCVPPFLNTYTGTHLQVFAQPPLAGVDMQQLEQV